MRSCVPFDFALMDRHHRPFIEGRRDLFITPFKSFANYKAVGTAPVAALFLYVGASGLIRDFLVEWNTAEAMITQCVPRKYKDHFNWWCLYSFKTENDQEANGKIVLDESERNRFSAGDRIPVSMCEKNLKTIGMPTSRCAAALLF
jgi:hypothetical protein